MFSTCPRFTEFDAYCPELTSIDRMFYTEDENIGKVPITRFRSQSTKIGNGYCAFLKCLYLESFEDELPMLSNGLYMFLEAILNKESALRILNSIPKVSGSHPMAIGIHVDHQADEEVVAAIENAQTKGWTLTVQWNGTATAQTASTFGLRKPPIYAKVGTMERSDGTTEQLLDWGHYVTDWEANGYMEFASVEEAKEYFNIGD
jgi:hypothetical protein